MWEHVKKRSGTLQLAFFVVKQLIELGLVVVKRFVHLVDPAVVFGLDDAHYHHHLLALETALVFFLFRCALVFHIFGIGSALE